MTSTQGSVISSTTKLLMKSCSTSSGGGSISPGMSNKHPKSYLELITVSKKFTVPRRLLNLRAMDQIQIPTSSMKILRSYFYSRLLLWTVGCTQRTIRAASGTEIDEIGYFFCRELISKTSKVLASNWKTQKPKKKTEKYARTKWLQKYICNQTQSIYKSVGTISIQVGRW